jgi:FAD/FMN-containing dehydrogenase
VRRVAGLVGAGVRERRKDEARERRTCERHDLCGELRGALCFQGEPGYEQARTLWNAMIDKHPAAVIRAAGTADVMRAVNVAREHQLVLAVRGGDHNIAGNAVCEGGLMLDLTPMKSVRVDPSTRTAASSPG